VIIGVVADDTTGANDIGIMFSKNGYLTKIVTFAAEAKLTADVDVIVVDTDSRLDPPELAYQKVFAATEQLQAAGCGVFHKKTCSVFRGNVGVEFDAMLAALKEKFMVVSLAFPKNGRQTVRGIHTVHGKRLEESEFARDPVHPMRTSEVVRILQEQTPLPVGMVDLTVVRQGPSVLRKALAAARERGGYCIVDAENQEDLAILAEAANGEGILGGSSALAEELPKYWPLRQAESSLQQLAITDSRGVLVVSGSLMPQTAAQVSHLQASGMSALKLDTRELFNPSLLERRKLEVIEQAGDLLDKGIDVLIMADNDPLVVAETKASGRQLGMEEMAVSKLVSAVLADVTAAVVDKTGVKRLVIAGGDTSGTVCRRLGITGNIVLKEIEAGLPSGLTLGREMLIVLKSGSFGRADFLSVAVNHLKELSAGK